MYIAPDSDIHILASVPLDKTYDHTIYWTSESAQANYFISKAKYTLADQSYQRVQRGYIRVDIQAENLYDCNYVMFRNSAFGSKWFYAFIKSVEYINNRVSQIEFEIDVMQTWFFDYTLDKCFVEREHTSTDGMFEHIIEENLEIGSEYVVNGYDEFSMNDMRVCLLINKDTDATGRVPGSTINNIYTPVFVIDTIPANRPDLIDTAITNYLEDEIICIYQYPAFIDGAPSQAKGINKNITSIDGYTPRNKKLFCYPFNFLLVSNNSGQTGEYRWEDFNSQSALFTIFGVKISTPAVICYPRMYRGMNEAPDDGLVLSNFPECAWSGDTFKAWWAQNKASFVTSGLTSAVYSSLGAISASKQKDVSVGEAIGGGLISVGANIARQLAKIQDIKAMPNQMHGQTQTDSLNPGMGRVKFSFYSMSIKAEYARIIDDYFDRYGYASKRNKVPNRNVRPHWTYTQTQGCTITGSIPADDASFICAIYNNGITFWNNPTEVGNYNLDNSV